jgi:hypothetical protein
LSSGPRFVCTNATGSIRSSEIQNSRSRRYTSSSRRRRRGPYDLLVPTNRLTATAEPVGTARLLHFAPNGSQLASCSWRLQAGDSHICTEAGRVTTASAVSTLDVRIQTHRELFDAGVSRHLISGMVDDESLCLARSPEDAIVSANEKSRSYVAC